MNYKKKITFLYSVIALTMTSKAQLNLSYNKISKIFSITTPAIAHPQVPGYNPYTNAIFETGTGAFFKLTTGTTNHLPGYQQQLFTIPWNFSPSDNIQPPFVQINSFYDTIRIPPHATSILNFNPPTTTQINASQNNELSYGQFIKINTSVSSPNTGISTVIPGDTMTVVLTYKNSSPDIGGSYNNSVIAFFYDPSDNPRVFNTIPTDIDAFLVGGIVPAIRKHNGETVLTTMDGFPQAIQTQLRNTGAGFNKVVYFSVPYIASGPERNIFLSMAPSAFPSDYTSGTSTSNSSFKAVLIDYKDLQTGNVHEAPQSFGIDFKSRDPNGIFTTPNCFDSLSLKTNQPINYRIHFENEGAGMAQRIVVTVSVPKGIQCRENASNMFTCTIGGGGTPVPVYKEIIGGFLTKFTDRRCYYRLDQSTNTITFTIYNAHLSGTVESQGINNTFGEIKFKLRTDLSNLPPCMFSNVSIVFDGQRAVTDSDLIQLNCNQLIKCANAKYVDKNPGR